MVDLPRTALQKLSGLSWMLMLPLNHLAPSPLASPTLKCSSLNTHRRSSRAGAELWPCAIRRAASEASSSATSFAVLLPKLWPNNLLPAFDQATRPHQHVLATRSGTEAFAHSLQLECDQDPALLVLSVDGIGAYDLIRRGAMLQALRNTPDAAAILPVVRLFYGQPSAFLWQDDAGTVHRIVQAKGGEQIDPLMPALFALGVAPALEAVQAEMLPNERVRAFLDDVYVTSHPPRVAHLLAWLQHHLFAHIRLNPTKTRRVFGTL